MKYYSINKRSPLVTFMQATISGQAPDQGLYFPEFVPQIDSDLIKNIEKCQDDEIAFRVIQPYVGNDIPAEVLFDIVRETLNSRIQLIQVTADSFALELFHGNTLAFKDTGARFMSRCLGHFIKGIHKKVTVLVATSGDTGGAVADGFFGIEGIDIIILYPSGGASAVQEMQLTSPGKNIHAIEVKGTFDDCQHLVKQAFNDKELNGRSFLTSANSINVARWLPQQFFYYFAYKQWPYKDMDPVISVPSGNFGNISAGLLAKSAGLPIGHLIAACNANDVVPKYMHTGSYLSKPSIRTLSNAMDVGNPSNFSRVLELFNKSYAALKPALSAYSISDEETRYCLGKVFNENSYMMDPHGAVGYAALQHYFSNHGAQKGIFMETAHPVKFYELIESQVNEKIALPPMISAMLNKPKMASQMEVSYDDLRSFIESL